MDNNWDDFYSPDNEKSITFLGTCLKIFKIILLLGIIGFIVYAFTYF